MTVARVLRRLLTVLELEEEQAQAALESALAALSRLKEARASAGERERNGRQLVASSACSGEIVDRVAGLEQVRTAQRVAGILKMRIVDAEKDAAARRESLMAKRVERRQAATLIEEAETAELVQASRREQQTADEWFLGRKRQEELAGRGAASGEPGSGEER